MWEDLNLTRKRHEGRKLRMLMRKIVDGGLLERFEVGVSGSCVLDWHAVKCFGRNPRDGVGYYLHPNDLDIFVCGSNGRTTEAFLDFVNKCGQEMLRIGHQVNSVHRYRNVYVHDDIDIEIVDVEVEGLETKLSFVQCPKDETVLQTVRRFDFDLVQVIYDFTRDRIIRQDPETELMEWTLTMRLSNRILDSLDRQLTLPTGSRNDNSVRRILLTCGRMLKYSRRGFIFEKELEVMAKANAVRAGVGLGPIILPKYRYST